MSTSMSAKAERWVYRRNTKTLQYQILLAGAPVPIVNVADIWFVIARAAAGSDLVYSLSGGGIVWTNEAQAICEVRIPAEGLNIPAPARYQTSFKVLLADGGQYTLETGILEVREDPAAGLPK